MGSDSGASICKLAMSFYLQSADGAISRAHGNTEELFPDNIISMPINQFAEIKEELKRAARNGENISVTVEAKMRAT